MNKNKALAHIGKYAVTYLFIALSVFFIIVSGLDINYVASQLLLRLNRNAFIVLALIIPIIAGMGINFAITIGAMAAQIGLLLTINWGVTGVPGILLAAAITLPLGAMFLNQFSLPAQFEKNGPGVLTGHPAETIPLDELRGGVLLDEEAAILLIGRGVDPCAKLTPDHTLVPAEGAKLLYSENGQPILWTGINPEGCRFAVFARNVSEIKVKNRPWPDRRMLQPKLAQAYAFLSGRPLPVLPCPDCRPHRKRRYHPHRFQSDHAPRTSAQPGRYRPAVEHIPKRASP